MKTPAKREGRLKVDLPFDEAIKLALSVKPPPEGWAEYDRRQRGSKRRKKAKRPNP